MTMKPPTEIDSERVAGCPPRPCSTFVRMFQPRFARLVEIGKKRQTVRKTPKRMPKKGDTVSLREWTGKPYRSKQRKLMEATLINVHTVEIGDYEMTIDGKWMSAEKRDRFARADGFDDWKELQCWFEETHGLPFNGICLFW